MHRIFSLLPMPSVPMLKPTKSLKKTSILKRRNSGQKWVSLSCIIGICQTVPLCASGLYRFSAQPSIPTPGSVFPFNGTAWFMPTRFSILLDTLLKLRASSGPRLRKELLSVGVPTVDRRGTERDLPRRSLRFLYRGTWAPYQSRRHHGEPLRLTWTRSGYLY